MLPEQIRSEYKQERDAFRMCLNMARSRQERAKCAMAKWWYLSMLDHRGNLRRLRMTGRVTPF